MRRRAIGLELGNNGGECNGVVVKMLLKQGVEERFERRLVEWMKLRGCFEPLRSRVCRPVLLCCGSMPQKGQES